MKRPVPAILLAMSGFVSFLSMGCIIRESPPRQTVIVEREPVVVEPAPVERVYVYEQGYPPGTYIYENRYYYGGYRYERNVFVTKVVNVNIQQNRYVNVTENRTVGREVERQHAAEYEAKRAAPPRTINRAGTEAPIQVFTPKPTSSNPPKKPGPKDAKDAKDSKDSKDARDANKN